MKNVMSKEDCIKGKNSVLNINGKEKWVKFSFSFSHCVVCESVNKMQTQKKYVHNLCWKFWSKKALRLAFLCAQKKCYVQFFLFIPILFACNSALQFYQISHTKKLTMKKCMYLLFFSNAYNEWMK